MGGLKLVLAFAGDWVRRLVPARHFSGPSAGVAGFAHRVLAVSQVFAIRWSASPSLTIVLVPLVGRVRLPGLAPGPSRSGAGGRAIFWIRAAMGAGPASLAAPSGLALLSLPWPTLAWVPVFGEALALPVPRGALRSGHGDRRYRQYRVRDRRRRRVPGRDILLTEAVATMARDCAAALVQNTPYIGHPAYKAMGAAPGTTLATAIVIGWVRRRANFRAGECAPEAAVAPILIFIRTRDHGSRRSSPRRATPPRPSPSPSSPRAALVSSS